MVRFAYITMSPFKKAEERVFPHRSHPQRESEEGKLYLLKRMMEKWKEEGEEMIVGKSLRVQLTSHSPNKMSDFSSSFTLLLFAPIPGSDQLSDLEPGAGGFPPLFFSIKMHWILKSGAACVNGARLRTRNLWCTSA